VFRKTVSAIFCTVQEQQFAFVRTSYRYADVPPRGIVHCMVTKHKSIHCVSIRREKSLFP